MYVRDRGILRDDGENTPILYPTPPQIPDKKRNVDMLREINSKTELVSRIRRRRSAFFDHLEEGEGLNVFC